VKEGIVKIYTKGGDSGQTGLFGGGRLSKSDARVESYGEIDELNAVLGVVRTLALPPEARTILGEIQAQLFTLGAELATSNPKRDVPQTQASWVEAMERLIDQIDAEIPQLRQFILPGGSPAAAQLHLARTVCRRAERRVVALASGSEVPPMIVVYLNRLSDLLFMLARLANHRAKVEEPVWLAPRP
jgi:cob(I)alamin adenosyltransferase